MNQIVDRRAIEAAEDAVLDVQFDWIDIMKDEGISRDELAERLGISKARVSQMLAVGANPTVKTMAKVYDALGRKVDIRSRKIDDIASERVTAAKKADVKAVSKAAPRRVEGNRFVLRSVSFWQEWVESEPTTGPTNDNFAELVLHKVG